MSKISNIIETFKDVTVSVSAADLIEWHNEILAKSQSEQDKNTTDRLVPRDEAAHILAVSISTLSRWSKRGYLPSIKIGRGVFYKESLLMKLIDSYGKK